MSIDNELTMKIGNKLKLGFRVRKRMRIHVLPSWTPDQVKDLHPCDTLIESLGNLIVIPHPGNGCLQNNLFSR